MEPRVFSALPVHLLLGTLDGRGLNTGPVLARHGLSRQTLSSTLVGVSPFTEDELYRGTGRDLRDEALALHVGEALKGQAADLFLNCFASQPNVRGAVRVLASLISHSGYKWIDLVEDARVGRVILHPPNPWVWTASMAALRLRSILSALQFAYGQPLPELRVHHSHPPPGHAAEYERSYGAAVHFSMPVDALLFDAKILDQPTAAPNPSLAKVLEGMVSRMTSTTPGSLWSRQVEVCLIEALPLGDGDLESTAQAFGLSVHQLKYKLEVEGTTFTDVLDRLRRGIALSQMGTSGMTVERLSSLLGYQTPRQFYRAFRRWTGATPGRALSGKAGTGPSLQPV